MIQLKKHLIIGIFTGTFGGLIVLLGKDIAESVASLFGFESKSLYTTSFILLVMTIFILIIIFYKNTENTKKRNG